MNRLKRLERIERDLIVDQAGIDYVYIWHPDLPGDITDGYIVQVTQVTHAGKVEIIPYGEIETVFPAQPGGLVLLMLEPVR